ncbi:ABC transporter permease [Massilia agilis]|uniref:ABC transporter permease n=1 Tax=Massilia agilis TaxID=1811226 RepID=A0ABT2DGY1_9BURK|nr:ABC transporter permease [Massilia agilis]MCS0810580.1 ABC transporter permease [Massilia agilis]
MARIEWRQAGVIARQEFRDRLRNRWVLAVALVLALLALAIAYAGSAQQGQVGFRGIEVTVASLTSLAVYLVPLIALMLGYDAIVGERERGSLDLLVSMPITRFEILLGKFAGLSAALACATAGGLVLAALPLAPHFSGHDAWHYVGFAASSVLMGMAFLSMAMLVSVLSRDRIRASGAAIGLWFLFVLAFDLGLTGALVASNGALGSGVFGALLMLNPADVFRMLNIFGSGDVQDMYGLATAVPGVLTSPLLLVGAMAAWIGVPLALSAWRFR